MLVTELFPRLFFAGSVAFYALLLYSVTAFFVTLMSSISVNVSSAEMKGKIHNANDYLSISPYFNAWDYGSDYNIRACFNAYAIERPHWSEPTHLQKLITSLTTSKGQSGAHQHSDACNHPPGDHSHNHSHDHPHVGSKHAHATANSNATSNAPSSSSRQTAHPVGDENV